MACDQGGGFQMGSCGGGSCGGGFQMGGSCGGGSCGFQMGGSCGGGSCGGGMQGGIDSFDGMSAMHPVRNAARAVVAAPVNVTRKIVAGWVRVQPVRSLVRRTVLSPSLDGGQTVSVGDTYNDVQGMLPEGHPYAGVDPITDTVNTTRAVTARLSRTYRAYTIYCTDGTAFVAEEPRVTLAQVAAEVPADLRGPNFDRLMARGSVFNLLTEWVASQNGAQVALEMGNDGVSDEGLGYAMQSVECCAYATAALQAIEKHDPNYVDRAKLAEFVGWGMARSLNLASDAKASPLANEDRQVLLTKITAAYVSE